MSKEASHRKRNNGLTSLPALRGYENARRTFLADYLFVLHTTGPDKCDLESPALTPEGFRTRPLAFGERWQEVHP